MNTKTWISLATLATIIIGLLVLYTPSPFPRSNNNSEPNITTSTISAIYHEPNGNTVYRVTMDQATGFITAIHDCGFKLGDTIQFSTSMNQTLGTQQIQVFAPNCPTTVNS